MISPIGPTAHNEASVRDELRELRLWRRLPARLTFLYGGLTMLSILLLGIITYQADTKRELAAIRQQLLVSAVSLAVSSDGDAIEALPSEPRSASDLHHRLSARFQDVLHRNPDIASIYILKPTKIPTRLLFVSDVVRQGVSGRPGELYDASGVPLLLKAFSHPVVESEPTRDRFGLSLSGYAPVKTQKGAPVAVLGVDVSASRIDQIRRDVLRAVAVSFGFTSLLLGMMAIFLGSKLREPLTLIMAATKAISEGELDTRVGLKRDDELGLMSRHIDQMAVQLQEREFIHDVFGRFLSTGVAAEVLRHGSKLSLGGEERVLSVLFMDLCGYSTISST